jgi:glutathione S-transferase
VREFPGVLDAHLAGRDWICGDALSLADFAIAAPFAATVPAKLPVGELSHLQRWFAAVQRLEAWKRTALP